MSSKSGGLSRPTSDEVKDPDLLLPKQNGSPPSGEVSDAESFTRTVAELDDDEELDMPEAAAVNEEAQSENAESVSQEAINSIEDDESTVRMHQEVLEDASRSVNDSLPSSPGSSRLSSRPSSLRNIRRGSLQPFDRRFSGMILSSPRAASPSISAALRPSHSRQSSLASTAVLGQPDTESPSPPWDVVRWTKLKKVSGQLFSEVGKRNYGRPTVMTIGATIVVGTSKGLALVFDYHQVLVATVGLGTAAVECGSITSLAISADHSTIAAGHATGHIFTWELSRPAKPFLHISPIPKEHVANRGSDSHVAGSAVVHVGFLGTRHTALVSADNRGMAFSHLATRGFGAIARTVKTARILGRYPSANEGKEKLRRASSVLAFSSLPLGNVEHPTDGLGLTALLTPYLLVIVSTTPLAETQFKAPRPKEIPPHSTLSGCLAWFPAVKLKKPEQAGDEATSKTKLVYCWSNVLTILDVEAEVSEEKDRPPQLQFQPRSRWRCQEPIVAVQWLSRSVIGILTISQRLIILEDGALRVTDSFDLIQKHIYHQDIFSSQLRQVVESLEDDDDNQTLHGVVADAFYMSFRSYKGRLFLLGFNDISVGTLSNWADRLAALLEAGEYIEAIRLAEAYYIGSAERITVGLPEDDKARHALVRDKLIEILKASIRYTFTTSATTNGDHAPVDKTSLVRDLASSSFSACLTIGETDFLFEEVFEAFEDASEERPFFDELEPYILAGQINSVPTEVFKAFVNQYDTASNSSQLEKIVCLLDVRLMDLDQIASICKKHGMYDALIYVWNQSIGEYVTPLIELLSIMKEVVHSGEEDESSTGYAAASKVFPYLASTLSGNSYPHGDELSDDEAFKAKTDVYEYLFSRSTIAWPPGTKSIFHPSIDVDEEMEYPYLTLILQFNAPSFLSMLNEAFEDQFLNGQAGEEDDEMLVNRSVSSLRGSANRQSIITILLTIMTDGGFEAEDTIYLDMFIARNLPKFPQFIVLPGNVLEAVLVRLCNYPSDELASDCQLSVEYLLSFYQPSDIAKFTALFRKAGFFRVLKTMYKNLKRYSELVETCFEDMEDQEAVFDCVGDCVRPGSDLTQKQMKDVRTVVLQHARQFVDIDSNRAATTILSTAPDLIEQIYEALEDDTYLQFHFLKALLESQDLVDSSRDEQLHKQFDEPYVQLLCRFEPARVAHYIDQLKSGDLQLEKVLPAIEKSGAIDAAITLLVRDGMIIEAISRLEKHLQTLGFGLNGLIDTIAESPDEQNTVEGLDNILADIQKYTKVGIWLCQGQTKAAASGKAVASSSSRAELEMTAAEAILALDELLWVELIDVTVRVAQRAAVSMAGLTDSGTLTTVASNVSPALRGVVQDCFTALLSSTSRPTPSITSIELPPSQPHASFLTILKAFLARAAASSPSLSELRAVLNEIFQAYTFEARILNLANQFLDKDLFTHVNDAWSRRQRGWRPRGNVCELCGKRLWGPGVGGGIWDQWEAQRDMEVQQRNKHAASSSQQRISSEAGDRGKGKALPSVPSEAGHKQVALASDDSPSSSEEASKFKGEPARAIVVFSCRHLWHRDCLERTMQVNGTTGDSNAALQCPASHIV